MSGLYERLTTADPLTMAVATIVAAVLLGLGLLAKRWADRFDDNLRRRARRGR